MSIRDFCPDMVQVALAGPPNANGERTFGKPKSYSARVEEVGREMRTAEGATIWSSTTVYIPSLLDIDEDDKVVVTQRNGKKVNELVHIITVRKVKAMRTGHHVEVIAQ